MKKAFLEVLRAAAGECVKSNAAAFHVACKIYGSNQVPFGLVNNILYVNDMGGEFSITDGKLKTEVQGFNLTIEDESEIISTEHNEQGTIIVWSAVALNVASILSTYYEINFIEKE